MPKAATIQAKQECRKVPRGQQMTVCGITFIPIGGNRFHVIAPVGCQIEVERVELPHVESSATSHPSDRLEP